MIYHETEHGTIYCGDSLEVLKGMADESVDCCITSPPYWGLRDYGCDRQLGLEKTPEEYVANMVQLFREVKRVLKKDGVLWLNLGDSYAGSGVHQEHHANQGISQSAKRGCTNGVPVPSGLKPKDLVGIPWRVAFALQADGWWLRQDIIWCLSGGTYLYVKSQKGEMPMTVKDMARLDPSTVKLWNGEKWTQLLGTSKSKRKGDEIELVLRSGERISCTQNHRFETQNGLTEARNIRVGDVLTSCRLPEPAEPRETALTMAAWLCGLYIAEGSKSGDTIQISGHAKETSRLKLLTKIAHMFGGHITHTIDGNNMSIRLYGKVLCAIIDEFVSGKTAKDKCFSTSVWQYSNSFIRTMMLGYLHGDGHMDSINHRWRIGFARNYNLERDLRTACARIGWQITLNPSTTEYNGRIFPTFRGEIRYKKSNHRNSKNRNEVVEIRKARCRYVYDIGVADEPHLFALASGILTHNSKPNPMPESVRDRCTKSHEYIFMLTKSARYYFDNEAIKENRESVCTRKRTSAFRQQNEAPDQTLTTIGRNKRSVWTVTTKPYKEAHFATYPPDLILPCVKAAKPDAVILDPFFGSGTTGLVAVQNGRRYIGIDLNPEYCAIAAKRIDSELQQTNIFREITYR